MEGNSAFLFWTPATQERPPTIAGGLSSVPTAKLLTHPDYNETVAEHSYTCQNMNLLILMFSRIPSPTMEVIMEVPP